MIAALAMQAALHDHSLDLARENAELRSRVAELEAARDTFLAAGGANPALGKLRFSVWNLSLLSLAFDRAAATARSEQRRAGE